MFDSFYSLVLLNYIILYTDRKFCCQSTSLFTTIAHARIKFAYISEIANCSFRIHFSPRCSLRSLCWLITIQCSLGCLVTVYMHLWTNYRSQLKYDATVYKCDHSVHFHSRVDCVLLPKAQSASCFHMPSFNLIHLISNSIVTCSPCL